MATNTIDAALVQKMFLAGAKNLESKKEWINDLNVFPVPDGDTGTNMTMTIMSAAKEVSSIANPTMENLAKAISTGSLRGARGNSGVILSQLLRGFTKEMSSLKEITVENLAAATQRATETAYKAVMKPKEGTILTVARGISEKAAEVASQTENLEEEQPEKKEQETVDRIPLYLDDYESKCRKMVEKLGIFDMRDKLEHLDHEMAQKCVTDSLKNSVCLTRVTKNE